MIKIENELWEVLVNQTYEMEFDWVGIDKIGQIGDKTFKSSKCRWFKYIG